MILQLFIRAGSEPKRKSLCKLDPLTVANFATVASRRSSPSANMLLLCLDTVDLQTKFVLRRYFMRRC